MDDKNRKRLALVGMFSGFPGSQAGELAASTYLAAVSDCSVEAVENAAREFVRGEVDGRDNRFCPTAPEFATRARVFDDALRKLAEVRAMPKPIPLRIGAPMPPGFKTIGPTKVNYGNGPDYEPMQQLKPVLIQGGKDAKNAR